MDNQQVSDADKELFGLSDLAGQVVRSDERTKIFNESFHLPWIPFPEPGVPAPEVISAAKIRTAEAKRIGQFIRDAYQKPFNTKVLVIKGQYGSGKSLLLKWIVSLTNSLFSAKGEDSVMAVYIGKPSFEAQELNRAILESLGMDTIRKMLWTVIKKEFAEDLKTPGQGLRHVWEDLYLPARKGASRSQRPLFTEDAIPQVFQSVFDADNIDDYRTFLSKYDGQGWNRTPLQKYLTGLLSRGTKVSSSLSVLDAYVQLLLAFDDREAWDSLVGLEAKKLTGRANFALRFLEDLLNILAANGFTYLFLIIDEFEQITEERLLTARDRADYGYTMMEVINKISHGLGIIFGITPEGYQRLAEIYPFTDRLVASIELNPLTSGEIKVLLLYYLDQAREESKEYKRYKGRLTPFSDEIVEAINNEIAGIALGATPRNVLQFAYHLLDYCATHSVPTITPAIVKDFAPLYRQMKAQELPARRRGR